MYCSTYNIRITTKPITHHGIYVIFQKLSNFIISQIIKPFSVFVCTPNIYRNLYHFRSRIFAIFCNHRRTIFFSASFISVAIYNIVESLLIAPLKVRTQIDIVFALCRVNHLITVLTRIVETLGVVLLLFANIFALSTTN